MTPKRKNFLIDTFLALSLSYMGFDAASRFLPYALVLNVTASIPLGVYVSESIEPYTPLRRTDLVCFRYGEEPAMFTGRNYFKSTDTLCKPVLGFPGDTLRSTPAGLFLTPREGTERQIAVYASHDLHGRPLTPFFGSEPYVLTGYDFALVAGDKPNSLDSRYIGPVDRFRIEKRIYPVFTWHD